MKLIKELNEAAKDLVETNCENEEEAGWHLTSDTQYGKGGPRYWEHEPTGAIITVPMPPAEVKKWWPEEFEDGALDPAMDENFMSIIHIPSNPLEGGAETANTVEELNDKIEWWKAEIARERA